MIRIPRHRRRAGGAARRGGRRPPLLPARRAAFVTGAALALPLGIYLTVAGTADWETSDTEVASTASNVAYAVVALTGLVLVTWFTGWHALWLLPATTIGTAIVWEALWWEDPAAFAQLSGMDTIGYTPGWVILLFVFLTPLTVVAATIRWLIVRRARR